MCRLLLLLLLTGGLCGRSIAGAPDSVYLFSYANAKDNGRSGLHFAWSHDRRDWTVIGNEFGYVRSDYGRWGPQKQMNDPYLFLGREGEWHCMWNLNETVNQMAHAASPNLVDWGRKSYPYIAASSLFESPVIQYNEGTEQYEITYRSGKNFYRSCTKDFKNFLVPVQVPASQYRNDRITVPLPSGKANGNIHRVPWETVAGLLRSYEIKQYQNGLSAESIYTDSIYFRAMKPLKASISVQPDKKKAISDLLMGVFFEDINYSADGGLYGELLQNRDFEYSPEDKNGRDRTWNSTYAWQVKSNDLDFHIDSIDPIHQNNRHYAVIQRRRPGAALINSGFDGIPVRSGAVYDLSMFLKHLSGQSDDLEVRLVDASGQVLAKTVIRVRGKLWRKYTAGLIARSGTDNAKLEICPAGRGQLGLDMISLFPRNTFRNRPNGMRSDLAETIAAIHPRFIRFPGGCVSHGDGLNNIYRWKNTIGNLEARLPQRNLWNYHQSVGLGYYEYFQFCEDVGSEPVPVIAAGVSCQNSGMSIRGEGQQGGIPLNEMGNYIQDILDLVEWANGPVTSKWGRLRAKAGHPKPFHLRYIGIGNEDLITDVFEERFTMIFNAIKKAYPQIQVIGTAGPFFEGTDYREGWKIADKLKVPLIDEHYYVDPGWFINNQDFYDRYDRNRSKVYLGEYASKGNTLCNALAEAIYLTTLERNGDIVSMASYAPLLAKQGHTQWNPDLVYFNNTQVMPTVNYEVQKLYGCNMGNVYLPTTISLSDDQDAVRKRVAVSVVSDKNGEEIIVKLVNLIPLTTSAHLDLNGFVPVRNQLVSKWLLTGGPKDKNVRTVKSSVLAANITDISLPPYSFTVLRIKGLSPGSKL